MSWIYLALAIVFEVGGSVVMKLAAGFSKLVPSILVFVFFGVSFAFYTMALKKLDISVTYPIWSGVGTVAIAIIGYFYFNEPMNTQKLLSIILIIIGVISLKLA